MAGHPAEILPTPLLDDGLVEHTFAGRIIAASGLRDLRIGQRVRYSLAPDGSIATLNLVSL
jgi:hypothetical protein